MRLEFVLGSIDLVQHELLLVKLSCFHLYSSCSLNAGPFCYTGGYGVATGGPTAWGLCYNKELSPSQDYCDDYYKYDYPCAPGAQYYGRGAIPIYWYQSSSLVRNIFVFSKSAACLLDLRDG